MTAGGNQRIIIADDDAAFRDIMADALRAEGYAPVTVDTEAALLTALQAESWDLVLLDSLGAGPPEPFLQRLARLPPTASATPIFLVTGWSQLAERAQGNPRLAAVIPKPFELDEMLAQIRAVLARTLVLTSPH